MRRLWAFGVALLVAVQLAAAQGAVQRSWHNINPRSPGAPPSGELTVEEQRKLGLSEAQILQIAEKRRDLEKERQKIEEQLKAAREAAAAANAQVTKLSQEIRTITTVKIERIYESVLSETQLKAFRRQRFVDQAKQWLRGYRSWLKLTDAQVDDISGLLVPVFEKYARMEGELADAQERLAASRRADKVDIQAIEKAEKGVAELSKRNVYQERQTELREAMRPGLMPDQLEKLDRVRQR